MGDPLISELIDELAQRDIRLTLNGDRLAVSAPPGMVTSEIRGILQRRKNEFISHLNHRTAIAEDTSHSESSRAEGADGLGYERKAAGSPNFWAALLNQSIAELELPLDHKRGRLSDWELGVVTDSVSATSDVSATAVLCAFLVTVARNSSHGDLIVGYQASESTSTYVPVRVDIADNPAVTEAQSRVRNAVEKSLQESSTQLSEILRAAEAAREFAELPLFQVCFKWVIDVTTSDKEPIPSGINSANSDIEMIADLKGDVLNLSLRYNAALFERSTAERIMGHFTRLLKSQSESPDMAVMNLPMLSDAEYHEIVHEWNRSSASYDYNTALHTMIAKVAQENPSAVAVTDTVTSLTYGELIDRATELAYELISLGVQPDSFVGIYVDRSPNVVVAAMAIWMAGAAYVPLDTTYPKDRLVYMVKDSGLGVIVTEEGLESDTPEFDGSVLAMKKPGQHVKVTNRVADSVIRTELPAPRPSRLAYIIYTSGSTGKPKGVMVRHDGVVNYLLAIQQLMGTSKVDSFFSVSALSFDISVMELFLPLISGARTIIAPFSIAADGSRLLELIRISSPTMIQATPALWRVILDAGWHEAVRSLRNGSSPNMIAFSGGEPLTREMADSILTSGVTLYNVYGPTEATVYATIEKVPPSPAPVVIGKPISNYQIYIINQYGELAPQKALGEICIGGIGVSNGYLNREDLTSQVFRPDPFTKMDDRRLYRTGDQGRAIGNGSFECLGRLDGQVKIRGFRIELGEIESVLSSREDIRESVVLVREDSPGDQRLVGYYQPVGGAGPSLLDLKETIASKLPHYMVPSHFVRMDSFPLTPSGKIDRKALPAPPREVRSRQAVFVKPVSGVETEIADLWKKTLGIGEIGSGDNFFDLGGHSLLAAQLQNELQDHFKVRFPLIELFRHPTIRDLTRYFSALLGNSINNTGTTRQTAELPKETFSSRARERAALQKRYKRPPLI